jgi:hypothetical protein
MPLRTKIAISSALMEAGLLPYLVVIGYIALTSGYRGDAAMAAVFTIMLGLGLSYVVALAVAFPAFLWSRSLTKSSGIDTRWSRLLRLGVIVGVFPVLAIFPVLALALLR